MFRKTDPVLLLVVIFLAGVAVTGLSTLGQSSSRLQAAVLDQRADAR